MRISRMKFQAERLPSIMPFRALEIHYSITKEKPTNIRNRKR